MGVSFPLRLGYNFLLVITQDCASGNGLNRTAFGATNWPSVLAPEIFASHCGIPMILDCIFSATGN